LEELAIAPEGKERFWPLIATALKYHLKLILAQPLSHLLVLAIACEYNRCQGDKERIYHNSRA
jgi:hypothetical protein